MLLRQLGYSNVHIRNLCDLQPVANIVSDAFHGSFTFIFPFSLIHVNKHRPTQSARSNFIFTLCMHSLRTCGKRAQGLWLMVRELASLYWSWRCSHRKFSNLLAWNSLARNELNDEGKEIWCKISNNFRLMVRYLLHGSWFMGMFITIVIIAVGLWMFWIRAFRWVDFIRQSEKDILDPFAVGHAFY